MSSPEQHALLSASSSHKWLICTPSARLEETLPETKSEYADEGKLAHAIAELKAKKHFTEPMGPKTFAKRLKVLQENPLYQEEMLKHTDTYLDYLSKIVHSFSAPPYIAIEKRLDYSAYAPEGFGTGDCIIIGGNVMHVIDFKYGKGVPVSAERNPQMMLYALGAYMAYCILYPIETIKMAIVQPRRENELSEYEMPIGDLLAWGESIKPIAQKAFAGEGDYVPGEHCRFCRAKLQCRARAEKYLTLEEYHKMKPPLISNEEVGQILKRAQDLAKWAEELEKYALAECLKGNEIPGWKAVEGRTSRIYVDQDAAFAALIAAGINEAILYKREPLSVAQVEKVLGKVEYRKLLEEPGLVKTEPGKPTLAPASDKREAIILQVDPQEVFKNETDN
ncbi:MAG: DUF2800 domain-containing protein [Peptococcaceae bacterium]|jgi:hypothetical protein|nr:DUF2800 domain-containing protein [Peptococcaceae bacterium]MDH7525262.1 DUF2800 domain-containing protein [Peptococcaceae bacterium]